MKPAACRTPLILLALAGLWLAGPAVAADWTRVGPPGGDVVHLLINPVNPQVLWAGTATAGIFRTVDGGASWTPANQGLSGLRIAALTVAPDNGRILYTVLFGGSVFRSADGGRTWVPRLDCQVTPRPCCGCGSLRNTYEIAVHPRDSRILYAATGKGVFKSVDSGATWRRTGRAGAGNLPVTLSLAIDPSRPEVLYAGGYGIYKSRDGGATWSALAAELGARLFSTLLIDPHNPRLILAGGPDGLFRSPDGGVHWRRSMANLSDRRVHALTFAPRAGGGRPEVWAGTGSGAFRSLDGGFTWSRADIGMRFPLVAALVAHPSRPGTLWAGTAFVSVGGRGVFKTTDSAIWRPANQGLRAMPVEDVALAPVTPGVLWAASPLNGAFHSVDGGETWNLPAGGLPVEGIFDVAFAPRDPRTVWAATRDGVYVSQDGGGFWVPRSDGITGPAGEAIGTHLVQPAPSDPAVVYAAGVSWLFRTVDAGARWTRFEVPLGPFFIEEIHVDPRDPDVVFVVGGNLFVSRDGGASWRTIFPGNLTARIDAFAIDPADPDLLWAGGEEGLFRSTDGGQVWQPVASFGLGQVRALAIAPAGGPVWALTSAGIARSPDGLTGWVLVPGLLDAFVNEIAIDPHDSNAVYAGTIAGLFRHVEGD